MMELLHLRLEAHNEERNHHRSYELTVGRDLLGDWVVVVRYGRVGMGHQVIQFGSPDVEAARRFTWDCLRRRLSAPRRLGCAYRIVDSSMKNISLTEWIPSPFASTVN